MEKKLSVGILIDAYQIPNWAYQMLAQILMGSYAQIVVSIVKEGGNSGKKNRDEAAGGPGNALFYTAICKLDRYLNQFEGDALTRRPLNDLLPDIPYIAVQPFRKNSREYFSDDDCLRIEGYKLDVLIKLGFGDLQGRILGGAKYGVWAYQHGDNKRFQGEPAGLWEVVEGYGETGSLLKIITNEGVAEKVLCRSSTRTNYLSINMNNDNNYWKSMAFVPRKLRELHRDGEEMFLEKMRRDNQHPFFYARRVYSLPKGFAWLKVTLQYLKRFMYVKSRRLLYFHQYILLFGTNKESGYASQIASYTRLIPPSDRFWADPFVIFAKGLYYVFIEEYLYAKGKGHISYLTIDQNGHSSGTKKIIDRDYHLSYPFVFVYENEYYMIPETGANKTIELYKCTAFPDKWEVAAALMEDIEAYDVTLLNHGGKWWLFANVREHEKAISFDELYLFFADDLLSRNWTPHPGNPIVSDVTSARPAGRIFSHNGNLYRPAQNGAHRYGYGMKINHIVTLTEREYREECVNEIEPHWAEDIVATHTLNFAQGLTVIDGLLRRPKYPWHFLRRLQAMVLGAFK